MNSNYDRRKQLILKKASRLIRAEQKKLKVTKEWFRFAKRTKYGYRFLNNKEEQFRILENIAIKLAKQYKSYTTGQIVDLISEMVNK